MRKDYKNVLKLAPLFYYQLHLSSKDEKIGSRFEIMTGKDVLNATHIHIPQVEFYTRFPREAILLIVM